MSGLGGIAMTADRSPFRVMVTGSRDWTERTLVRLELLRFDTHRPVTVIHGAAPGLDSLAAEIAGQYGYAVEAHPANWEVHGRAAGPIRNRIMLSSGVDLVLAFHKRGSRGTADAVREAKRRGIPVRHWIVDDLYPNARLETTP